MIEYIKIAVFFVSGIYLSERISLGFSFIFTISLIMVLTIQAAFKHKFNIKIFILMFAVIFGAALCWFNTDDDMQSLSDYIGSYVTITGRISEIPERQDDNIRYVVKTDKVSYRDTEKKIKGKILLTSDKVFEYGDTIVFSGITETLPKKMNTLGADYELYYKGRNIFAKMYSSDVNIAPQKLRDFSPYALGLRIKCFVSYIIDENYKGDYAALLKAVLVGNKKEFSQEFDDVLTRTGVKRFFYPAFLHIMLYMSLIGLVLGAVEKKKRDFVTVFLLIIYAMFNAEGAVFVKLCVMLSMFTLWKHFCGRVYYPDVLGTTAIIMGLINPLVYFNAGFAISMLSSIMIYYFYDCVESRLKFIRIKYFRRIITLGIICTAGLIPIAAYFFNYVSLFSMLLSAVMLPCVTLILLMSVPLIIMLALFHTAPIAAQVTDTMLFVLKYLPIAADKLHLNGIILAKPSVLFLIIYALLVVAAVKRIKNKKRHMMAALFTAAALTVSAVTCEIQRLGEIEITFVNVGQGDGALIKAPHRFNVLIDGGGGSAYSNYDAGKKIYLEYLKSEGISSVDSAFVSHYHKDHVQGIIAAVENIKVRNLFMPDEMEGSEWRVALEKAAEENGTKIHYISEETLLTYNNTMTVRIVPPTAKTRISDDENDTTYVYYVEYGGFKTVFTGDMSFFAEQCLLDAGKAEKSDLLKVAHHGSRGSTSAQWLETIKPRYALISVGEDNTYGLPSEETLARLGETELYRTDTDGDVTFTVKKNGKVKIETLDRR